MADNLKVQVSRSIALGSRFVAGRAFRRRVEPALARC